MCVLIPNNPHLRLPLGRAPRRFTNSSQIGCFKALEKLVQRHCSCKLLKSPGKIDGTKNEPKNCTFGTTPNNYCIQKLRLVGSGPYEPYESGWTMYVQGKCLIHYTISLAFNNCTFSKQPYPIAFCSALLCKNLGYCNDRSQVC